MDCYVPPGIGLSRHSGTTQAQHFVAVSEIHSDVKETLMIIQSSVHFYFLLHLVWESIGLATV
jgi:hypothetical protein